MFWGITNVNFLYINISVSVPFIQSITPNKDPFNAVIIAI